MSVREQKRTIPVVIQESFMEEITFWAFSMSRSSYGVSSATETYYMTTLPDERNRLWVQFHRTAEQAVAACRGFYYTSGSLTMTWGVFEKAARRVLRGEVGERFRMPGKGTFIKVNDGRIEFITTCQEHYRLEPSELEGLLA